MVARSLLKIISGLRDEGKCIIFSTHIMREVERICDRVAILYRGCILDEGNLEELSERHQQNDFEELFFELLSNYDRQRSDSLTAGGSNA
jgi:sodium transport system ATP-binding protein